MIEPPRLPYFQELGWELRWQLTAIEPVETSIDLQGAPLRPAPRTNVVVSRSPTDKETASAAAEDFWQQTAQAVPGIKKKDLPAVTFADGVQGAVLDVTFLAASDVTLWQRHFFRLDPDGLTQLVLTCDSRLSDEEKEELATHVLGFTVKPPSPAG
jgi:hypothetical protein